MKVFILCGVVGVGIGFVVTACIVMSGDGGVPLSPRAPGVPAPVVEREAPVVAMKEGPAVGRTAPADVHAAPAASGLEEGISPEKGLYVLPNGAGAKDGATWADALDASSGGLQKAWDEIAPGETCFVGSGRYDGTTLTVTSGGKDGRYKKLLGVDTGEGLPHFVGSWDMNNPRKGGPTFIQLVNEVDYCRFENLKVKHYQRAIFSRKGRHQGLRIRNVDVSESRFGVFLYGFAYEREPEVASHDVVIEDCEFIHFTKSGVRLEAGNYDVRISNCIADAGGKEWYKESFPICFNIPGGMAQARWRKSDEPWAGDHDITFVNCVAKNAYQQKEGYWNADGYTAERKCYDIRFINCAAFDCTDGGWDIKAKGAVFINCVGFRSKMNYRIWNEAFMYNCISGYAFKRGGSWTTAGLWTLGDIRAVNCTFHNNRMQIFADKKRGSEANVTLEDCIVSFDGSNPRIPPKEQGFYSGSHRIEKIGTVEWHPSSESQDSGDPQYVAGGSSSWEGEPEGAFDSKRYGPSKGYNSSLRDRDISEILRAAADAFQKMRELRARREQARIKQAASVQAPAAPPPESGAASTSLLKNGDFALVSDDGLPRHWRTYERTGLDVSVEGQSLRVHIRAASRSWGQILQRVEGFKKNTMYVLAGQLRGTEAGFANFQVKLYKGKKELKRISTARNDTQWKTVTKRFSTGDADRIEILCRWRQEGKDAGKTVWFANVKLTESGGRE